MMTTGVAPTGQHICIPCSRKLRMRVAVDGEYCPRCLTKCAIEAAGPKEEDLIRPTLRVA
jgi:hypothetical protein